ncbi:hypothetical protein L218DRAFT_1079199 [Marasmius fiardii PR-910]|nr:hypothetical protein L218DRAFT_1079199 [Marasmius fiardii PR-910]
MNMECACCCGVAGPRSTPFDRGHYTETLICQFTCLRLELSLTKAAATTTLDTVGRAVVRQPQAVKITRLPHFISSHFSPLSSTLRLSGLQNVSRLTASNLEHSGLGSAPEITSQTIAFVEDSPIHHGILATWPPISSSSSSSQFTGPESSHPPDDTVETNRSSGSTNRSRGNACFNSPSVAPKQKLPPVLVHIALLAKVKPSATHIGTRIGPSSAPRLSTDAWDSTSCDFQSDIASLRQTTHHASYDSFLDFLPTVVDEELANDSLKS